MASIHGDMCLIDSIPVAPLSNPSPVTCSLSPTVSHPQTVLQLPQTVQQLPQTAQQLPQAPQQLSSPLMTITQPPRMTTTAQSPLTMTHPSQTTTQSPHPFLYPYPFFPYHPFPSYPPCSPAPPQPTSARDPALIKEIVQEVVSQVLVYKPTLLHIPSACHSPHLFEPSPVSTSVSLIDPSPSPHLFEPSPLSASVSLIDPSPSPTNKTFEYTPPDMCTTVPTVNQTVSYKTHPICTNIINLSGKRLSCNVLSLLAKGLSFIPKKQEKYNHRRLSQDFDNLVKNT